MNTSLNKISGGDKNETKVSINGNSNSKYSLKSCKGSKCSSQKSTSKNICSGIDCIDLLVRGDMFPFY